MSILTAADVRSVTWRRVASYAETRLAQVRAQLEADHYDHADTQALRARISELRLMLSLAGSASDSSELTPSHDEVLGIDQA